jgi:hypothetical protein
VGRVAGRLKASFGAVKARDDRYSEYTYLGFVIEFGFGKANHFHGAVLEKKLEICAII